MIISVHPGMHRDYHYVDLGLAPEKALCKRRLYRLLDNSMSLK